MLGNLFDFDPQADSVDVKQMPDMDRFMLHRLQSLIRRATDAYNSYEFHVVYHSLYQYCTIDLSAVYLDIIKDRLYTSPGDSPIRRSAQTVMYHTVSAITRMMAPILPFTAEEVWSYIPGAVSTAESVHFTDFPEIDESLIDKELAAKWDRLLAVRGEATRVLENARVNKTIGHSLDASLTIAAKGDFFDLLQSYAEDLRAFFIVSQAQLVDIDSADTSFSETAIDEVKIRVVPAAGDKCQRCWVHDTSVGKNPDHPMVCSRCQTSLDIIESRK